MEHRQLKYGRVERERRFLLRAAPDLPYDRCYEIVDRYLIGTRLRLRRMEANGQIDYKLARKLPPHEPGALVMGNLYLSADEYALMSTLPARELRKRRSYFHGWGIDAFSGVLDGLILAEIECDDPRELAALEPPFPTVGEVTDNHVYSGGHLAALEQVPGV